MPFAVAASSVPILAFAPLFNNWFGLDQQLSKAMVAAALCFFPVMINTVRGLTIVDPGHSSSCARTLRPRPPSSASCACPTRCRTSSPRSGWRSPWPRSGRSSASTSRRREPVSASTSRRIRRSSTSSGRGRRSCSRARSGIGLYLVVVIAERIVMPWHDRRAAWSWTPERDRRRAARPVAIRRRRRPHLR